MSAPAHWTCPTCAIEVTTPFCPQCGESPLRPPDLTLRGIAAKVLHAATSIDGRLLRTVWCLLCHPGQLTVAHLKGQRMPYVAPFQLFLIANAFFFAMQSLTDTQIFGSTMESHLNHQDWSPLATTLVAERVAMLHTDLAQYTPEFNRAAVLNAKSLIILMVVPFALLLSVTFAFVRKQKRKPFVAYVYFSLHLYAFLLLLFSLALMIAAINVHAGGAGLASPAVDKVLSLINLSVCGIYAYLALGPVFDSHGLARFVRATALTIGAAFIVLGYRFVIFLITLYLT
ncbi:DUF3667 domain-containing protein [Caballeronia humi]|uniref:DUF3667 domain-containing protein n=1 Tax=Caballeronia humi TaxID=326474 RepID=A0A158GNI7_9BURK|nr:DUF3667 domain-containing protein [Caballeronia humi]SAL33684.1 hypothetical protein AWB65_02300 [Caballeronia humi]